MVNYYLSLGGIAQLVRAPASHAGGHRFEPRCLHHEKSTSSEVLFSMKRTLRCMKNEAGLRPMKRGFAARRGTGASLHVCRRQTLHCWFCNYILLLRVKSQRRRVDFISLSAEQKISRPQSGYFTFCICKKFRLSFCTEQAYEAAFSTTQQLTDGLLLIYWVGGR